MSTPRSTSCWRPLAGLAPSLVRVLLGLALVSAARPAPANPTTDDERVLISEARSDAVGPSRTPPEPEYWFNMWPDGSMGVRKVGSTYYFYQWCNPAPANAVRAVGTLDDPIAAGPDAITKKPIENAPVEPSSLPRQFEYVGVGPVYTVPGTENMIAILHMEDHLNPDQGIVPFWTWFGLARSTDGGVNWKYLGLIFETEAEPWDSPDQSHAAQVGPYVIRNVGGIDYFYVYDEDRAPSTSGESQAKLCIFRAPVAEVIDAAFNGNGGDGAVSLWWKYYNPNGLDPAHPDAWLEPAIKGKSTRIGPATMGHDVKWNPAIGKFVLLEHTRRQTLAQQLLNEWEYRLQIRQSADGFNWSTPTVVRTDDDPMRYPAIIGPGADPMVLGRGFYMYWVDYDKVNGWSDAHLMRRTVHYDTGATPITLLWDDAESGGAGQWTAGSDFALSTEQANSPSHSWRCGPAQNTLESVPLDASGAYKVRVEFYWRDHGIDPDDNVMFQAWDGSGWQNLRKLDSPGGLTGTEGQWHQATVTLLDPAYLQNGLKIRFEGSGIDGGLIEEALYVDDIRVEKFW